MSASNSAKADDTDECPECGATFQCSNADTGGSYTDDEQCRHGRPAFSCELCEAEASPEA